jgi:hypothetical protein
MMLRASLLVAALLLAGCAQTGEGIGPLRSAGPRDPYLREFADTLSPQYNRTFPFPVDAGASSVNLTITLHLRSGGLAPGNATPAAITVTLLDPSGAPRGEEQLDPSRTLAYVQLERPLAPGTWRVQVAGSGGALDAQGVQVSTGFVVGVAVAYR